MLLHHLSVLSFPFLCNLLTLHFFDLSLQQSQAAYQAGAPTANQSKSERDWQSHAEKNEVDALQILPGANENNEPQRNSGAHGQFKKHSRSSSYIKLTAVCSATTESRWAMAPQIL